MSLIPTIYIYPNETNTHLFRFKVEYHANENPLENSEKIAYVGLSLMYPIIKNKNFTMLGVFLNTIKILGFYVKNSSFENILLKLQIP